MENKYDVNKTRYTHRDYETIKKDLIDAIPSLTQEWTSREDADPGIVLVKLMSMFGDTLSYNVDKIALELYLSSVTQRKNCAKILKLLGYKMHWYRAARVTAHVRLATNVDEDNNRTHVIMSPFNTKFHAGSVVYSVANQGSGDSQIDIYSSSDTVAVQLVQGIKGDTSFSKNDLVNNRFYLGTNNVDESEFLLTIQDSPTICELVDNLYLVSSNRKIYYEFDVDEFDRPYIQLADNWEDVAQNSTGNSVTFNLSYIVTDGARGNISNNAFSHVTGLDGGSSTNLVITNIANTLNYDVESDSLESYNSPGFNPQSVDNAKYDAANYVFTHDTLVTPSDYEKAAKRYRGVTVSKLVDAQVVINDMLDLEGVVERALDNQIIKRDSEGHAERDPETGKILYEYDDSLIVTVEEDDPDNPDVQIEKKYLSPRIVFLYLVYRNFDPNSNFYYFLDEDDEWSLNQNDPYGECNEHLKEVGYYPYRPNEVLLVNIREMLEGLHILNVDIDFTTTKVFPFRVKGTLHLTEPMSPQETLQIVDIVDTALEQAYYPSLHPVGEKPNFIELVDVIQGSDVRIKYFDAIDNIVEWAPAVQAQIDHMDEIFDTTSAIMYNGLSQEFNLDKKFMLFRMKNVGIIDDSIDSYTSTNTASTDYMLDPNTAYLYNYSQVLREEGEELSQIIKIKKNEIAELQLTDIDQLRALCKDINYKGDALIPYEVVVGDPTEPQTCAVTYGEPVPGTDPEVYKIDGFINANDSQKITEISVRNSQGNLTTASKIVAISLGDLTMTLDTPVNKIDENTLDNTSRNILNTMFDSTVMDFSVIVTNNTSSTAYVKVNTNEVTLTENWNNIGQPDVVWKTTKYNNTGLQWVK